MAIPIIGELINGVKDVVSEVVVDKDKRDQVNLELRRLEDEAQARLDEQVSAQIEVNKVEAASSSVLVAGWRPAVGWVCALGILYSFILMPFMSWVARVAFEYKGDFPALDMDSFIYILFGMLGIGTMRTFEKIKGVASNDTQIQPTKKATPAKTEVPVEVAVEVKPKKKGWKIF